MPQKSSCLLSPLKSCPLQLSTEFPPVPGGRGLGGSLRSAAGKGRLDPHRPAAEQTRLLACAGGRARRGGHIHSSCAGSGR